MVYFNQFDHIWGAPSCTVFPTVFPMGFPVGFRQVDEGAKVWCAAWSADPVLTATANDRGGAVGGRCGRGKTSGKTKGKPWITMENKGKYRKVMGKSIGKPMGKSSGNPLDNGELMWIFHRKTIGKPSETWETMGKLWEKHRKMVS